MMNLSKKILSTPSRTYRLITNDQQQPIDGRYVVPSNNKYNLFISIKKK